MTNREACEPCAKRKVRCDKREPCSNCKRRKADRCVYPSISPVDRIKRLEALVRRLGGDPNSNTAQRIGSDPEAESPNAATGAVVDQRDGSKARPVEIRSHDPVVIVEDGQSFYLESRAWQGWLGNNDSGGGLRNGMTSRHPFLVRKRPHALSGLFGAQAAFSFTVSHPSPGDATILWNVFYQRVEPLVRICFRAGLSVLRMRSIDSEKVQSLSAAENALILAIYYISLVSLRDEECSQLLQQSRAGLLSQYHEFCEEALLRTNLLCMTDILVIKAIIFYMMASFDRLSIQSLWSLMGMTVRNAEKLGLHRDGTVLGLSPMETEDRRRAWWQLQHVDLCLGIWGGMTPMTLMADWDAKIPSNIEDEDLNPTMTEMPKERKGLTSMSYSRYTYYVLDQQRRIFQAQQGRFALSWQSNTSLSSELKDSVISQLEDGLNQNFLQYCDPLKPLDTLLLLVARYLIVGMKMRILHATVFSGDKQQINEDSRTAIANASAQCLRYYIATQSQQSLRQFQWISKGMFSWHAFMFVLVEVSRKNDTSKAQETWDLLANVYAVNAEFFELSEDRRRLHAAELVVSVWKVWHSKFAPTQQLITPEFVTRLETELAINRARVDQEEPLGEVRQQDIQEHVVPITPESFVPDESISAGFDFDFQDIDWTFWNSMD